MRCEELKTLAHDYFTGQVAAEQARRIEAHFDGCAACRGYRKLCLELSCREFIEFLNDYIDDELEPERRRVFERHLSICSDCTHYLAAYRATIEMSAMAVPKPGLPDEAVPTELVRAILAARKQRPERG